MHYSYGILVWWIFWIFLLFLVFATPGIFQIKRRIADQKTNRETPIKILRKRLPGGEITKEEFVDMKKRIEIN